MASSSRATRGSTSTTAWASLAEDRKWRAVSRSADSAEPYPAEFPPDTAD